MNRREFGVLTAGMSALLGVEPLTALEGFAHDPAEPMPVIPAHEGISLSINGLFMQDYALGSPWSANPASTWIEPYVAADGSQHIFSVPFTEPENTSQGLTVEGVSLAQGSLTGWDRQTMNVGPRNAGTTTTTNSLVIVSSGRPMEGPRQPGDPPAPILDMLLVYRNNSVERCTIRPDGMLWDLNRSAWSSSIYPLVTGQLDPSTRYIPEVQVIGGVVGEVSLRSVVEPSRTYYATERPFDGVAPGIYPRKPRRVFPLKGSPQSDSYRCITVDNSGNVRSLLLVRDQQNNSFHTRERVVLAQSSSGCVHVHELETGTVEVILFDVAGTGAGIRTIVGTYDPQSVQPATWQAAVQENLTGFRVPFGAASQLEMVGAYHADVHMMDLFVMVRDSQNSNHNCELWTTTRCHQQLWRQMLCVEKSCRSAAVFRSTDTVKLLIHRELDANRFQSEIWSREVSGSWAVDVATLPVRTGKPAAVPSYRVGVKFIQGGVSLPRDTVRIAASVLTVATVNGRRTVLPTGAGLETKTDASGTVWIVLPLENRISFPTLTISSDRFRQGLILPLNKAISDKFASIQAADLTSTSAKGGALLMGDSAGIANDLAQAMRSILAAGSQVAVQQGTRPAHVEITSNVDYFWENLPGTGAPHPHPQPSVPAPPTNLTVEIDGVPVPPPSPAWKMGARGGFQSISVGDARGQILNAIQTLVYAPANATGQRGIPNITTRRWIWDDIKSGFEDAAEWVGGRISDGISLLKNAAARVTSFVMDGASLLVKIVVNGIEYAYAGVINTIEAAMDAIHALLQYAGLVVGKAANWLLNQLGFLFDWEAIKRRRNDLKTMVRNNTNKVAEWLPDPAAGATRINNQLSDLRTKLQSYNSAAENSTQFPTKYPLFGGMPSLDDVGGTIGLPKLTMITDKLYGALEKIANPLGTPAIAWGDQASLISKATEAFTYIPAMAQRLETAFQQWVSSPSSFLQATGSAVADVLLAEVDRLIELLQDLVSLAAGALKSLIDGVSTIFTWLDRDLDLGFLSGFYEGLVDNKLSLMDLACLGAAICLESAPAAPSRIGVSRAAADSETEVRKARNAFLWVGVLTNTADAAVSALFPGTPYSSMTTGFNLASLAGAMICSLIDKQDLYVDIGIGTGTLIAAGLYGLFNKIFVIVGQILLLAVRVVLVIYAAATANGKAAAYNLANIVQTFFAVVVNIATTSITIEGGGGGTISASIVRKPLDPDSVAVHAAGQFFLGGVCYAIQSGRLLPA